MRNGKWFEILLGIIVVIAIVLTIIEAVVMLWLKISVVSSFGDAPNWLKWILIFK